MQLVVIGVLAAALIGTLVMLFISVRGIKKALEEPEPEAEPSRFDMVRSASGEKDSFVSECFFAIGILGRPKPFKKGEPPQVPVPHIGVLFICDPADEPTGIVVSYSVLDYVGDVKDLTIVAEKVKGKIFITVQAPVPDLLAEDIQEKLNLYGKADIKLGYKLVLKGESIDRLIDTSIRWRSPVQDEDLSQFIGQFRS